MASRPRIEASAGKPREEISADNLFAGGGGPTMGSAYNRITERIFSLDPISEYDELERRLTLGKKGSELTYAELIDALEVSEDSARRAHALYCHARVELEKFEIDSTVREGAMMTEARKALEELKSKGEFGKTIAAADLEAYAATHNVDAYRDLKTRRAKNKRTVDHLEQLAAIWRDRRRTLETMTNRVR